MADHMIEEHLFGKNAYEEPKIVYDNEAIYTLIIRLLLLEPGKDPNRPDMGVGLISKYRYTFEENLSELRTRISNQIRTYLPDFFMADVDFELKSYGLLIYIKVDNVTYGVKLDSNKGDLSPITLDDVR